MRKKERAATVLGSKEKPQSMAHIMGELKKKMAELDELKARIEKQNPKKISAQKTKQMLEEIVVPPLELIKVQSHRHKM